MNADTYVNRIKKLLMAHRSRWCEMDRAGVASYRYFVRLTKGEYATPGIHKLAAIEDYLTKNPKPKAKRKKAAA